MTEGKFRRLRLLDCATGPLASIFGYFCLDTVTMPDGRSTMAPPPEAWPDGHGTQVLRDADGKAIGVDRRQQDTVIEVIMDEGSLAFAINGKPPIRVPDFAFAPGARLRPWVDVHRIGYNQTPTSFTSRFVRCC